MSVRVTLNCVLKAKRNELLMSFLAANLPNVRGFDGCLGVAVYFDDENGEMLLEEEWLSVQKHYAYIKHIEENGVLEQLAAFFETPPSIKYFTKARL
ncbi:antibiotic biosynthesis monooxygenase [Marinomonas sp. PE14-40]|uniref:antibiotic biosynthesis monooxygenase n=1 Tax=Marinomonas sp. PE14-40 TaxID=3060621 RepID=UPI003F673D10